MPPAHTLHRELARLLVTTDSGLTVSCATGSMVPTICVGEKVVIHAHRRRPRAGDVVLLEGDRSFILHRVLWSVPGLPWIVHGGDAAQTGANIARANRIVGTAALPPQAPPISRRIRGLRRALISSARAALRRGTAG